MLYMACQVPYDLTFDSLIMSTPRNNCLPEDTVWCVIPPTLALTVSEWITLLLENSYQSSRFLSERGSYEKSFSPPPRTFRGSFSARAVVSLKEETTYFYFGPNTWLRTQHELTLCNADAQMKPACMHPSATSTAHVLVSRRRTSWSDSSLAPLRHTDPL